MCVCEFHSLSTNWKAIITVCIGTYLGVCILGLMGKRIHVHKRLPYFCFAFITQQTTTFFLKLNVTSVNGRNGKCRKSGATKSFMVLTKETAFCLLLMFKLFWLCTNANVRVDYDVCYVLRAFVSLYELRILCFNFVVNHGSKVLLSFNGLSFLGSNDEF